MNRKTHATAWHRALMTLAALAASCMIIVIAPAPALAAGDDIAPDASHDCRQQTAPDPGLECVSDSAGRFALWSVAGWTTLDTGQGQDTVLVIVPDAADWSTGFRIDVTDSGRAIPAFDLPGLITDFDGLVHAVPGAQVLWQNRWFEGSVIGFDARYTIVEGDKQTVRWVRMLNQGTLRFVLVAEAGSADEWANRYPMFLGMMLTFRPS